MQFPFLEHGAKQLIIAKILDMFLLDFFAGYFYSKKL